MKPNLLIVDDEKTIRETLSRHFRFLDYDVETACNGAEALEILAHRRTEVVISDIMMPEMDGIELLRRMRGNFSMTHVIMITGNITLNNALACMRLGADTFIFKPLEDLSELEGAVEQALSKLRHWQEKLKQLEQLNVRLHDDATNLTRALTRSSKAQGNWGEQQLERLLELAGLQNGREFHTQVSVTTETGQRVQPDLVLSLPEGKSIVMDSKVSLTAWLRYQSEEDETLRAAHLKDHVQSIRQHVKTLGEKRYAEVSDLGALDFVLMFIPIESAMIEALQFDAELPAFAMENKVSLVSPTNLLATLRTVGSVWAIHRQNTNAREIAGRAGLLYDKFAGFVKNLQQIGDRLRLAQQSYDDAVSQLSSGQGNLLRQAELLKELGARASKQIDPSLGSDQDEDAADNGTSKLEVVHESGDSGGKYQSAGADPKKR